MKKPKIFIACDTNDIGKVKKIIALTKSNNITGNSKHNPKANINFIIRDKYSEILGSNSIGSEPSTLVTWNERKKSQAKGITT